MTGAGNMRWLLGVPRLSERRSRTSGRPLQDMFRFDAELSLISILSGNTSIAFIKQIYSILSCRPPEVNTHIIFLSIYMI